MKCQKCNSERILYASCKCSDRFYGSIDTITIDGYVPDDLGIGGGDYIDFKLCLDCGQLQGNFPLPVSEMEKDCSDEELLEFFDENFSEGELIQSIPACERMQIIKMAGLISLKLREYILDIFDCHGEITSTTLAPSTSKFIIAYKNNSIDI